MEISGFQQLKQDLKHIPPKTAVVAAAHEEHTLQAVRQAQEDGLIRPVLVGDAAEIQRLTQAMGWQVPEEDVVDEKDEAGCARRAVELLDDNDSVIVASGSTIHAFAEEIRLRPWHHLNIVTPFLRLGVLLNEVENVDVVQLGGAVHKKSLSVSGSEAVRALDDCICSKVFFGVDGIDLEHGITTSTIEEAKLTRRMMEAASQTIVLADSSKFGQRGFGRIGSLEEIDVIVTEAEVSEQMASALEEAGVDLIVVK